jgi:sucrose-6-phosphate hydrolase SacC (GH32 family)
LFDRSVIEVFGNDGETVLTDRVYPTQPLDRLELLASARAATSVQVWRLQSAWRSR